ncbi:MAG: hypothetical protein WCO06_01455 [Candidatus Roizmanbacteria bacterium]
MNKDEEDKLREKAKIMIERCDDILDLIDIKLGNPERVLLRHLFDNMKQNG